MLFCVHKDILGTSKFLLYKDGEYAWVTKPPHDTWIYGDRTPIKSLDILLDFLKVKHPMVGCPAHKKSLRVLLGSDVSKIPWHSILPQDKFQKLISQMVLGLEDALQGFLSDEYHGNFISQRTFLQSLSRACINNDKLNQYISSEKNQTVLNTLRSFMPLKNDQAGTCIYDQGSTVTGRLTVKSGPQVLILPKKYRDILHSRYTGGSIVQVDFVSLEPRFARLSFGMPSERDVYLQLSKELFDSSLTREQCKLAVLCALYGVSKKKLGGILGSKHNPVMVINRIKDFFGVKQILSLIKPQLQKDACFRNYFGRKIQPDRNDNNALINYYIQSSSVDAALKGFINLKLKIDKAALRCTPLFVIHDALVLDIHPQDYPRLKELLYDGIDIPTLGEFPVTLSTIAPRKE